ncbi:MAG: hypothetical protein DMG45_09805 [Acidobacteria bacterium]|nr:MAG: hypothetical protein DMG45_09805 [Acidobacteriota bacterium]
MPHQDPRPHKTDGGTPRSGKKYKRCHGA